MDKIDAHAEALLTGLTEAPAWPTLRSHLALIALDEHSPLTADRRRGRRVAGRHDPAAVLDARSTTSSPNSPPPDHTVGHALTRPPAALPWLPGIPARLAEAHDWGPFMASYHHQLVREQIDAVREAARGLDRRHRTRLGTALPRGRGHRPNSGPTSPWRQAWPDLTRTTCAPPATAPSAPPAPTRPSSTGPSARHVRATPSQRTWYQVLPETVRADRGSPAVPATRPPRARRAARDRLHQGSARHRPLPPVGQPGTDMETAQPRGRT